MPIRPPALDDRTYDDLVQELLARVPAHTPEWTNPSPGDPGRTLLELFAWLADTILYRANLIPERSRLAFLRLLGAPLESGIPARATVSVLSADADRAARTYLPPYVKLRKDKLVFETLSELTVLPLTAEGFYKRPLTDEEKA